ncbi:MAG: DUF721 domain-containing protein [Phormidesmis sp.]
MGLDGLGNLIKGLESQESWQAQRQFRQVLQQWPKAVGFAVARHTRPVSVQQGTLYVAASTAAWAQTLLYERFNILRKLNRHQRQPLKNIRFSTAQWAQSASAQKPSIAMSQHPSYLGHIPTLPLTAAQTPAEAFQRWASAVREMQTTQALCPQCRCHCPQGEIDRWRVCSLCATKRWQ